MARGGWCCKTVNQAKKPPQLTVVINGYVAARGLTKAQVGAIIGTCDDTARVRLKHPEEMSLRQLTTLAKTMDIPKEEFLAAISY